MARPPPDPALVERALRLVEQVGPEEAARRLAPEGVSKRTLYAWKRGENGARPPGVTPKPPQRRRPSTHPRSRAVVASQPAQATTQPAAADLPAVPPPPEPPAGLTGVELDLWFVEQEINAVRIELHTMRVRCVTQGSAALGNRFDSLLDRRETLRKRGQEKPDGDANRRWRVEADKVIAQIEKGVRQVEARRA